ncbi:hypothetical protein OS493_009352 [Desmophyllum pertusum]|uniref:Uncharacterized protein n=1 Tax=Desmophyllum pertusum TaxID=174260 RepID=A0A9X0CTW1_9CNID|nr:hypothetical protein OS493_009352 [Desmophyllum pertusum]
MKSFASVVLLASLVCFSVVDIREIDGQLSFNTNPGRSLNNPRYTRKMISSEDPWMEQQSAVTINQQEELDRNQAATRRRLNPIRKFLKRA